jgi:hypothetical protein
MKRTSQLQREAMPDYPIVPIPEPTKSEPLQGEVLFGPSPIRVAAGSGDPAATEPMLALLDLVSFVMDRLIEVPGTKVRVGLNSLLLLLPVVGDAFSSAVSAAILTIGLSVFRVPRIIAVRMMTNSLIDASIGWIPILGDVFNLWFKVDTRNVRLLMDYASRADREPPPTWKHWLFVIGMGLVFLLVLALIGMGAWSLIVIAVRWLQPYPAQ